MNVFSVSIRATEDYEFDKIRTAGVTGNATIYKNSQGDNICSTRDEISQPSRPFSPRADTDNQVSCQHLFWSGGWDASPASPPVSAPAANVHFHFPLRNLQPQTCGLMYKFHEEMHGN